MIGSTTVMGRWPIMTFLFVWILLGNFDLIISVSMMFQRTRNISTARRTGLRRSTSSPTSPRTSSRRRRPEMWRTSPVVYWSPRSSRWTQGPRDTSPLSSPGEPPSPPATALWTPASSRLSRTRSSAAAVSPSVSLL